MLKSIDVVFDGKAFIPTDPVDLPSGTRAKVSLIECSTARSAPTMTTEEAERILRGDGTPLPWATVEEAMAYSRGRPWPELLLGSEAAEGNGT